MTLGDKNASYMPKKILLSLHHLLQNQRLTIKSGKDYNHSWEVHGRLSEGWYWNNCKLCLLNVKKGKKKERKPIWQ